MEARAPLIRLAQDARTYRRCAVTDTEAKIEQMEEARTEYRGALLWMKDVSEELDPDTFRKLEKFRKVQGQVRSKKEKFDCHKLDTLQKIDLLAISRLNMLSQSLTPYGTSMNDFHEKVAAVLAAVVIPGHNPNEAELGLLQSDRNRGTSSPAQPSSKDDDALLDLSGDNATPTVPNLSASSELLDAFWKESGLDNNNFDPLSAAMDGLSFESGETTDRQDQSPDNNPLAGLFDFSELDEAEKGNMGFFAGDTLQPTKSSTDHSSPKDTPSGYKAFLPSQLLKKGWTSTFSSSSPTVPSKSEINDKTGKSKAWQDLFADLDPLTNQTSSAAKQSSGKEEEGSC